MRYKLNYRVKQGFMAIEKLKKDWNSYGAIAPTKNTIQCAKNFVGFYHPENQPEIEPQKDGSIYIYQKNGYVFRAYEGMIKFQYVDNGGIEE